MYPRFPWGLEANPFGSAEHTVATIGPDQLWGPLSFLFGGHQQTRTQNFSLAGRRRRRRRRRL